MSWVFNAVLWLICLLSDGTPCMKQNIINAQANNRNPNCDQWKTALLMVGFGVVDLFSPTTSTTLQWINPNWS